MGRVIPFSKKRALKSEGGAMEREKDIDSVLDILALLWCEHINETHPDSRILENTDEMIELCDECRHFSRAVYELASLSVVNR